MKKTWKILCLALSLLMLVCAFCACAGEASGCCCSTGNGCACCNGANGNESGNGESESITVDVLGQESGSGENGENEEQPESFRARILLVTDIHYCHEDYLGADMDQRISLMVNDINEEHKKDPLSMILFLGDYSLDHWKWQVQGSWLKEGKSYTKMFLDQYKSRLPDVPMFFVAGNHEQYGEALWQEISGNSRQGTMVLGDNLFIMWDSYGGELDPDYHHDGVYTPMDVAWVRAQMDAHPDKSVFLVSHYFNAAQESEAAAALIADKRVICLFAGHNHKSGITTLGAKFGYKTLIFCGNYSQSNGADADPGDDMWGFRELILTETNAVSHYIVPENYYAYGGNTYHVDYHYQNVASFKLYR